MKKIKHFNLVIYAIYIICCFSFYSYVKNLHEQQQLVFIFPLSVFILITPFVLWKNKIKLTLKDFFLLILFIVLSVGVTIFIKDYISYKENPNEKTNSIGFQ